MAEGNTLLRLASYIPIPPVACSAGEIEIGSFAISPDYQARFSKVIGISLMPWTQFDFM